MEIVDLVIAVYHLLVRAVALALSDEEFARDWVAVEAALERLGVDVPGYPASEQAVSDMAGQGSASENTVRNADGSLSLAGE